MMDLMDLPDELLLCCVCGTLRLSLKLATTSDAMRERLVNAAASRGLRFTCNTLHEAVAMEHVCTWPAYFEIGELVLLTDTWPFNSMVTIANLLMQCKKLHTVLVNPAHAAKVKKLYASKWANEKGGLTWLKEKSVFSIVARPVTRVAVSCSSPR